MEEIKDLKVDVAAVKVDVAAVKRDTKYIRDSVKKINGRVATVEEKSRNFEENARRKELDCPYREVIVDLSENKMTQEALKEFIRSEEERRYKEAAARDRKLRWIIGAVGVVFTVITILVNLTIFYIQNYEKTQKDSGVSAYDGRADHNVLGVPGCFVVSAPV